MVVLESEYFTSLLLTFTGSLIIGLFFSKWYRERNYPPGPIGLPFLGYGVFLGSNPHKNLDKLGKKYGDIFSFYLGPHLHISTNDFSVAKELLTHPQTISRPEKSFSFIVGEGGFSGKNGEEWQEQRRFTFYTMRNLGMGKGLWETMIQESAVDFVEEIKSWKGKPSNFESALTFSQATNAISLLIGRHLDKEKDAETIEIIRQCTRDLMAYFSSVSVNVSIPGMSSILSFFKIAGYHKFFPLLRRFEDIFKKEVEERRKNTDSWIKEDFIGCYLREIEKKDSESKNHTYTIDNLNGNLVLLFVAGNESTMAGVSWLMLLMAENQDIQKKVHEEIDNVIGRDGLPSYDDKSKFPYTIATILEMTRWVPIAAIFPPRYVMKDFTVNGYTIPRGSNIICNAWSIMRDPKHYKDPSKFKPERFLSQNGERIVKTDGYLAFSLGKRNCPGEGIAIMTIFLNFISIMQKFHVKTRPGTKLDFEPVFGGTMLTKPQDLCFIER